MRSLLPCLCALLLLHPGCGSEDSDRPGSRPDGGAGSVNGGAGGSGVGGTAVGGTGDSGGGHGGTANKGGAGGIAGTAGSGLPDPQALAAGVDADRYHNDVVFVTGVRKPDSPHWQEVQDYCATVLAQTGFQVELHDYGSGVNVVGVRQGQGKASERVLLGAHYDHIAGCPGADDNATGVAGVLEAARALSAADFERTLVMVCFDEEEAGYKGSQAYAARAAQQGENLATVVIYDMIGFTNDGLGTQQVPPGMEDYPGLVSKLVANGYRANFLLVANNPSASAAAAVLEAAVADQGRVVIRLDLTQDMLGIENLRRSDHAAFWDNGYPAMTAGDTAEFRYPAYHCKSGDDVVANLNFDFAMQTVRGTVVTLATSLGITGGSTGGAGGGAGQGGAAGEGGESGAGGQAGEDAGALACGALCALTPSATETQAECAAQAFEGLGYPISTTAACETVATVLQCYSCMSALGASASDCATVQSTCF